jgi:hypothetical protein
MRDAHLFFDTGNDSRTGERRTYSRCVESRVDQTELCTNSDIEKYLNRPLVVVGSCAAATSGSCLAHWSHVAQIGIVSAVEGGSEERMWMGGWVVEKMIDAVLTRNQETNFRVELLCSLSSFHII